MNVAVKEKLQNQKGFTIIEVVLVLAIAGLIFLMVFIALPALQSSQRDTARKNDVSTIMSSVTSFTGNNRGTFPSAAQLTAYSKNVSDNIKSVTLGTGNTVASADGVVVVTKATQCDAPDTQNTKQYNLKTGTARQFTVVTQLEAGGGTPYCQQS